ILDCVDGNIARVKKQSSEMGEFIDALSGYYVTGFAYLSIGVSAFYTTSMSSIPPTWFIILGGISSVSGLLARIIHQKYTYSLLMLNDSKNKYFNNEQTYKRNNLNYLRERIDKELNISGLFMPFLIVSAIFNLYDIMTIFYLILQLGGLFIVTLY
ncbi:CDP-alcohol phosphatidyltransferase family protein, partial [Enterococcus faecium]|uniref:CDP-alcohol phosphatidyltransferase family protein n=2 Tax=Enterococcus TaxID=1350 RepID=UPI001C4E9FEC